MKQCPSCLNWIDESAAFCPVCGLRQAPSPGATWNPPAEDDPERTQPLRRPAEAPVFAGYTEPSAPAEYTEPTATNAYHPVQPPPAAPAPQSLWDSLSNSRALIVVLGVVFLCAASLAVLTLWAATNRGANSLAGQVNDFFEAPSETPLPATPLPSPTPWPTFTPAPTETSTPVPTETSAPVPTETSIPVPQEPTAAPPDDTSGDDKDDLQILSPECAAALDRLEQVSTTFTRSPLSIFDADWRAEAGLAVEELRSACGTLDSASPLPGQVQEVQRLLALTSQTYTDANRLLKEGIDERRPAKIWEAIQQYYQAIQYLNQSIKALREIG